MPLSSTTTSKPLPVHSLREPPRAIPGLKKGAKVDGWTVTEVIDSTRGDYRFQPTPPLSGAQQPRSPILPERAGIVSSEHAQHGWQGRSIFTTAVGIALGLIIGIILILLLGRLVQSLTAAEQSGAQSPDVSVIFPEPTASQLGNRDAWRDATQTFMLQQQVLDDLRKEWLTLTDQMVQIQQRFIDYEERVRQLENVAHPPQRR